MIKLGITGGIGSGKSTVTEIFSLCGVPVYIADIESKKLVNTSPVIRQKLTNIFGEELYKNNVLNKALLASLIFSNKDNLNTVNTIIHPEVEKDFEEWVYKHQNLDLIVHEAAILFESGFNKFMDKTITVYTPIETRIQRAMTRDHTTREKIQERMLNQIPDEEKIKLSDFVIVNDGTQSLIEQVINILKKLRH